MKPIHPIIERANAVFPNLEVELGDEQLNRSIISRRIGRYAVTHLQMPDIAAEVIGQRAVAAGLGGHFKLIWQLTGRMRYEDSNRKFDVAPGDLVVTSMAEDYRLEMLEENEALVLIFDPADDPKWLELARERIDYTDCPAGWDHDSGRRGSRTPVGPGRSLGRIGSAHDDRSGAAEHTATRSRRRLAAHLFWRARSSMSCAIQRTALTDPSDWREIWVCRGVLCTCGSRLSERRRAA